ncbi:uncharacterized protein LOC141680358 [Apium graveolens]|uniref:uncharacterized protein LOC141680358 n=1 Tax=Apium graveolens TaxID=4045 RepID=UPI003D796AF4
MECGLLDLGFTGNRFTWKRSRGTERWVQERLDRGLASKEWVEMFPGAEVQVLEVSTSDHMPLFLQLHKQVYVQKRHRFRLENMWIRESECKSIIQECWNEGGAVDLLEKMVGCCVKLEEWGGGLIKDMKVKLAQYRTDMKRLRNRRDASGIRQYEKARWLYLKLREKKEIFWRQRAKQFWLHEGDKNTRFFHKYAIARKEHNRIKRLKDDNGDWKDTYEEIQEVKHPKRVADLRPISLCNVLMRVLSKILANRVKPMLKNIISEQQSAFIEGRLLTDNALIALEVNHFIHRKTQGLTGVAGLKIDVSKAYDRLEWRFIEFMLQKFGFPQIWIERVMKCIRMVSYSFLRDGQIFGNVVPQRGVRQGDPISPYIYIICAESLSRLMKRYEDVGLVHGCKIARGAPPVSHLLFADDCYLFFKAKQAEASTMRSILQKYERVSGQMVNYSKSNVVFSPNTTRTD